MRRPGWTTLRTDLEIEDDWRKGVCHRRNPRQDNRQTVLQRLQVCRSKFELTVMEPGGMAVAQRIVVVTR
jgi:hypothetical protein